MNDTSKRNVLLLALCQALFMTSTSANIASAALVGNMLAIDKALATLPVSFQFAATMLTAYPASIYMRRVGRRFGFITGALIGVFGAVLATWGIYEGSFWLFCAGTFFIGSFNSFAQFFRFAAADTASESFKSTAISLVLAGGVVAAFTGPNLAIFTKDMLAPVTFAGIFVAIIVIYFVIIGVLAMIQIPRPTAAERAEGGRPLVEIVKQPKFIVALLGAVLGYVVMSFLMTVTPIAMMECGFEFSDSAFVIQGHILGMFAPAFITGHLIKRFGVTNIMLTGASLFGVVVAINLAGIEFLNFFSALLLLGIGWNFLFVGGTTLLTECYTPAEKAKAQGFNDLVLWGSVMVGTLLSGATNHSFGWAAANIGVVPFIVIVFAATLWLKLQPRQAGAQA